MLYLIRQLEKWSESVRNFKRKVFSFVATIQPKIIISRSVRSCGSLFRSFLVIIRKLFLRFIKVFWLVSKTISLFLHRHLAVKPHQKLTEKVNWYGNWHEKSYHGKVHSTVLAAFIIFISILLLSSYKHILALSDISDTWDFSNAINYTLDSGLETSGSSVRLKAQNYSSDAHTSALYHFDEVNGSTANDSSANNNNASVNGATFGTGNLNNALSFNGTDNFASVPNSSSLSLSQTNSLEAWTKFNSNFSSGSSDQRQGILDKGDYQLYYDNETGKVTYELADNAANSWTLAGGNDTNNSWDQNGKLSANAVVKMGSNIYAGLGVTTGDAEVWKWDGTNWSRIGGGPNSDNNSWAAQTFEGVYALSTDGTNLYAGLGSGTGDAEVWKWNGTSWLKIGGDGINSGWAINTFEQVWTLDYFGGHLYAGIGSSANDAEVWEWNGSSWTKIGGDSLNSGWTTNYEIVGALTNDGTNLYAGLGTTAGDGEVWKWDGSSWTKIGGDSLNSGWDNTIETVRSLRYYGSKLYAGLGDTAGDADVYSWDGSSWTKIGGDGLNSSWAASTYEQVGSFAYDGTNLYVGLGTSNGDGEVWKWNGTSWSQIGGDGLNSSWTTAEGDTVNTLLYDSGKLFAGTYDAAGSGWVFSYDGTNWSRIGGNYINFSWGYYGYSAVQVMQNQGSYLYAGMGNTTGAATVWQYDGTNWSLIGGQGVNGSWDPQKYEMVLSMASYKGKLYVGLGNTATATDQDGEIWCWDGTTWTKVGGNGLNSSWNAASHYGEIDAMAVANGYLYAGLGQGANDAEIWRYDGTSWSKIGGDSLNNGWTNYAENVYSMSVYKGKLEVGLGRSAGDAEVWEWSGSSWNKIGGDTVNSGWDSTTYEEVESLVQYNGNLYAGLGSGTGDASLWEFNGSTWSKIGGDDVNSSWTSGTYEKVKTLAVYNGDLYVGLGNTAGDGEVWQYKNNAWNKIAGNGINNGWGNTIEEIESFSAYKGKFYVGTGLTSNADALVYSWGNNAYLQSTTSSFNTSWHHIAATYDGTTMKIYIDGVPDASKSASVTLPQNNRALLIGTTYGGREYGKARGYFNGKLDEVRISDIARTSFTSKPYPSTDQVLGLNTAVRKSGVWHWDGFNSNESANGGSITYRLSSNGGTTWQFWNGSAWADSSNTSEANDVNTIDNNIATFPVTFDGIQWQAILHGDGSQQVTLNGLGITATSDLVQPDTNASSITAQKALSGASLSQNAWTNGSSPYFSWSAGNDSESGVLGYCLYLGTDNTADPVTAKGILGTSPVYNGNHCQFVVSSANFDSSVAGYLGSALATANTPYYLTVKTIDKAGNVSDASSQFYFRFDNTPPSNPGYITGPSGFINTKDITLSWPTIGASAANDDNSGVAGLQYKIGATGTWYGDSHSGSGDINDLLANDGSYSTTDPPDKDNLTEGINTVYFRTWDQAGNTSSGTVTAALKINTAGAPSEPQNLTASPTTNSSNVFAFSWDDPTDFVGNADNLDYCYTINSLPNADNCVFTGAGVNSLASGPYATQPGLNTIYVVAKDESGNINYDSFANTTFTANTSAPGAPTNSDIVDVSIKSTNNWRLALTWDAPDDSGTGVASYKIYRSTDDDNYNFVGSSSSTTYIDAGLSQQTYYYKVKACDNTNNCGVYGTAVHELPTGKFTSAATLVSQPVISDITTKKATIRWSTDRGSDSKIAIGTASGKYGSSEIANSAQVSAHEINLTNLSAGTHYYFISKWTDEDGNTGSSQEFSFTTAPAPSLKEVKSTSIGLSNATIQFTSKNSTKVSVYYGLSEGFGGVKTINTSTDESNYSVSLDGLNDGSKYFYKLVTFDIENTSYDGSIASFSTQARPKISNLRFQPVRGEPTSTQKVSWDTNVPSDSTIIYGITGKGTTDSRTSKLTTSHEITIRGLQDNSQYSLVAQSRDASGNLAVSDSQSFHTALDTRPPELSNITVEPSIRGVGTEARGQVVVSWHTDEPASSQVAYAEGSHAVVFNSKTSEDSELSTEHVVIVSDLPTSRVYSLEPISRDRAGNAGLGESQSAIIGKASDSVLTIVLNTLRKIFGF